MESLVHALGDPQHAFPVIHVTGTNGKGSTARMITRLLLGQGLVVGTYTSPHLERYNERIRVADVDCTDDEFASAIAAVQRVEPLLSDPPSHFEILTAAAFVHFADVAVDVAVIEVGLLGRYDATNVCDGAVAVVTNIGRDHTDFQGDWRARIAREKAGVIKPSSHLILGETDPSLREIFLGENPAAIWERDKDFGCGANRLAVGGRVLDLRTPLQSITDMYVPLHGAHQGDNAAVALAAADAFFGRPTDPEIVREAFASVQMPGRFEVLGRDPLVILDGAHNPDGAEAAGRVLAEGFDVAGSRTLVVGMLNDRDAEAMLRGLGVADFDRVICCTPPTSRALPAAELALSASSAGIAVVAEVIPSAADALGAAFARSGVGDLIMVTGSLYLVGEARGLLRTRKRRPAAVRPLPSQ